MDKRPPRADTGCRRPAVSTREAYEHALSSIIDEVSSGLGDLPGDDHDDRAIALLSLLAGGVTLARAVHDPAVSERIANAVARPR